MPDRCRYAGMGGRLTCLRTVARQLKLEPRHFRPQASEIAGALEKRVKGHQHRKR